MTPPVPDRTVRVLLVEDEAVNRALVRAVLARVASARLELVEAINLATARAAIRDSSPEVVLLDVRLPDGDGLDLARGLPPPGTPGRPSVVVMSASVLPADVDAAHRSGGDAFLGKPFRPAELIELLDRLLADRPPSDIRG